MNRIYYYIVGLVLLLFFAACSSSRKMQDSSGATHRSVWETGESVVSSVNIGLSGGNGKNVKMGGSLRMERDDVIQLNATYILGLQVGTLEITKNNVLLVSRTTRQYAVVEYQELSVMLGRTVSFDDFQSIFWGEAKDLNVEGLKWKYGSFVELADKRLLPNDLDISFSKGSSSVDVSLQMSRYRYDKDWNRRTRVNTASYSRLTSDQIVKLISLILER